VKESALPSWALPHDFEDHVFSDPYGKPITLTGRCLKITHRSLRRLSVALQRKQDAIYDSVRGIRGIYQSSTCSVLGAVRISSHGGDHEECCKIWGFHGGDYEEWCLLGYKNPVHTSQETHYVSVTELSRLMRCKIWDFHRGDYEERRLLRYKNPVRTSQETHYVSATEPSRLMLCKIWGFSRLWLWAMPSSGMFLARWFFSP
jgi:hypothetical protein